jgi:hypothetical protein
MEKHRRDERESPRSLTLEELFDSALVGRSEPELGEEARRRAEETIWRLEQEQKRQASRRKWIGWGLSVLGVSQMVASCPFYLFSVIGISYIGPLVTGIGLLMLIAGGLLIFRQTPARGTHQALVVALRHGNALTVPRLALEMDISFRKAEEIVQELVKNGVAEIDLDHKDSEHALVYRIKGL